MSTLMMSCSYRIVRRATRRITRFHTYLLLYATLLTWHAVGADFTVSSPGYSYTINGMANNPTLTLVRGKTYSFQVNASSIHPFYIESAGVQNNNINSGTITYTVPTNAVNYSYYCSIHGFGGTILTVAPPPPPLPPPPPPKIRLLSVSLGTTLTLRSTGTNTWSVKPQYSTNLAGTNWYALTVLTNRYVGGTNETICGLPPANGALIRIKAQPN